MNKEKIKKILKKCLLDYTMGDCKTDIEEKNNFVNDVMKELNNSKKGSRADQLQGPGFKQLN